MMSQRGEKNAAEALDDERIRQHPRRWDFAVDARQLAPVAIPFAPRRGPGSGIITCRQIRHLLEGEDIGGEGCGWRDRSALSILFECGLRAPRQVERFDARSIEAAAVD